jgi:hypothetical protein
VPDLRRVAEFPNPRRISSTTSRPKGETPMATAKQRAARRSQALSTAEQNDLPASQFAFPKERKEPLTDARHVRNAVARFDQVEGVSNTERDRAWKRIQAAAKRFGVTIEATSWRELVDDGKGRDGRGRSGKTKKR